jgi:hypothetical protein
MSYITENHAYCLSSTYGLNPPRSFHGRRHFDVDCGKFEPDHNDQTNDRTIVLANCFDKTNCLVRYVPSELELEW